MVRLVCRIGKEVDEVNLSADERAAFSSLLYNDGIVIRPADKGSGIIVLDKLEYISKLSKEMEDDGTYTQTRDDHTQISLKAVKKLVN